MKVKHLKHFILFSFMIFWLHGKAQTFPIDTIFYNGNINKLINMVILSDGYTSAEMGTFITDANSMVSNIFAQQPFKEYKNYFNVFAIKVPSPTSGINHPNSAPDCSGYSVPVISGKNPYFGTVFDAFNIHRLVVPINVVSIATVMANNFPSYDQIFVLANSPYYGGSGGDVATATTDASSSEVAIHEIGHSFAGLSDEYWAGASYAAEKPNMTQQSSASLVKWKNWLNINNIGIYLYESTTNWYRPHQNCKMRYLSVPFCSVCAETFIEKIHSLTNPIYSYLPAATILNVGDTIIKFSTVLLNPIPNTLKRNWTVNGTSRAANQDSLSVSTTALANNSTIKLTVLDTTALTKSNAHPTAHLYSVTWTIKKTLTAIKINSVVENNVFTLYPNPGSNQLNISYELQQPSKLVFDVIDITGREIISGKQHSANAGKQIESIDISNLTNGEYFVRILKDSAPVTLSFIKIK